VVAVSIYLDTNVVGALLIAEPLSDRAERYLDDCGDALLISDLTAAEFSSLVARRVRTREFIPDQARAALANFDRWIDMSTQRIEIEAADMTVAMVLLRRLDLPLHTLDALHIAIAQRLNARLVTFDRQMVAAARGLGMAVAMP
jgi:predicted nucleic acid-binding protein